MNHLLRMLDLGADEILEILDTADQLKYDQKHGIPHKLLAGKTITMIFEKQSTRTRVAFEMGMYQLGGHALFLQDSVSQIGRGEAAEDTARVLSRYCDGIVIRTFDQQEAEQLARYATCPVINAQTDDSHPMQTLADLMTIRERKVVLAGLRVGFIGDGFNVCNSTIVGCLKMGMIVTVACPEGYAPHREALAFAVDYPQQFTLCHDPRQAAKDADVLFTDVWTSMGKESERQARRAAFAGFCLDAPLLELAAPDCMVQHSLPAHKGEEITADVFERHAEEIFDETENRLHVQKAVLSMLLREK
ncbi:MAG: ornithine carbamoyltransferase [Oscillospiraceae bacterium]|nr:ornithine carbamoyltransferase [Oscillospiraceae bacterium]